jgi:GPI inositol-deacylase
MSSHLLAYLIGLLSLCLVALLYNAALDTVATLSPQGCRMSWMSPSYLLQTGFNHTWTPLAGRYSLWLYREVGWEGHEVSRFHVSFLIYH